MKRMMIAALVATSIAGATVASAETVTAHHGVIKTTRTEMHGKQIEKVTCREFLALQEQFQPQAVSYAIGYDKARKPDDAILDVSGIARAVPVIQKSCRTTPQLTLIQRIRADLHKL
jgi:hypothetical protein